MKLVIVESPSKAKTIAKYLGKDYIVDASGGHIRDLPEKALGVDINNNFEPKYVVSAQKKDLIKRLIDRAKKADEVLLATDPDREGEAISWHLANLLKIDSSNSCRIEFNEISQKAVKQALQFPRKIDINLVDAQQARRVLDRLVGYKLSPLLCKKIQEKLSGGRVQSVALRLIVEREREIQAFIPEEFWSMQAKLTKHGEDVVFTSDLTGYKGKKLVPKNKQEVDNVLSSIKNAPFVISEVKEGISYSAPQPPFTTSTMQQDASNKLSFASPKTMLIAQQLYEGIDIKGEGHIAFVTYIRTDSVRVSVDAQSSALEFIKQKYGEKYAPEKPNFYATKKSAQDAHEAIRPISLDITPEAYRSKLSADQYKLYKLIYNRFLASQMAKAEFATVNVKFCVNDYDFKTVGKTMLFNGFTAVYKMEADDENEQGLLPKLTEGEVCDCKDIDCKQKWTKPPARYTDASLVKSMEQKGIGRPSTYASIIAVLTKRQYTVKDGKSLKPTPLAFDVNDLIVKYFDDIINTRFTADMEEKLDQIEEGGKEWQSIVGEFYYPFQKELAIASTDGDELSTEVCAKCGSAMIIKSGKFGKYLACSAYPECKNIVSIAEEIETDEVCPKCGGKLYERGGRFGKYLACKTEGCKFTKSCNEEKTGEKCPTCGCNLVYKTGRYGKYIACENGDCKYTKNIAEVVGVCPSCGKELAKKRSKSGKTFYGCSDYPNCTFVSWDLPIAEKCPKCNSYLLKKWIKTGTQIKCSNTTCDYMREENKDDEQNS